MLSINKWPEYGPCSTWQTAREPETEEEAAMRKQAEQADIELFRQMIAERKRENEGKK